MMADKPLICAPSVARALWEGRQTQDRRPIKLPPKRPSLFDGTWADSYVLDPGNASWRDLDLPYHVGDRLWVRESYRESPGGTIYDAAGGTMDIVEDELIYRADSTHPQIFRWRPSIHMPRYASRMTLLVTDVRVQRLQDISDEDAQAEGIFEFNSVGDGPCHASWGYHGCEWKSHDPRESFQDLWNSLYGSRPGLSWADNPWVCAAKFETVHKNIDQMEK